MRICVDCGRLFRPDTAKVYRCPRCEPTHRTQTNRKQYQARRARGRRTSVSPEYRRNRKTILANEPLCHWGCGRKATTADHVRPVVEGGTDDIDNLVPSCGPCNFGRTPHRKP